MSEIPRSADALVDLILETHGLLDPSITKQQQEEVLKRLAGIVTKQLPAPALVVDKWLYRLVVIFLGIVTAAAIFGAIILAINKIDVPEVMTALGAAAIGALAGLLAPSPAGNR
jgi:hypothetical protein